jgi:hypothetical protein
MHLQNVQNAIVSSTVTTAGGDVLINSQKVTNYHHSIQYQELEAQRKELQDRFENAQKRIKQYPDDEDFKVELLHIAKERREVEKKLEEFKAEVIRLAETFTQIPLNTERLKRARQHFETGDYPAARAILDAELMGQELEALLQQKTRLEEQQAENEQHLSDKADEFLILARLTAIDFKQPDRFEKTQAYFEQSLKAAHTFENTFAYAYFLQEHNQFNMALPWYKEALKSAHTLAKTNPEAYLPNVATTLNNLGLLQADRHELAGAAASYREALDLWRRLAKANPEAYLPDVATTLNNLGVLQADRHELAGAEASYREALDAYRRLAEVNPEAYLPNVATILNNLGNLQRAKNELAGAAASYREALDLWRRLAKANQAYLPDVAMTLNNLGNLQVDRHEVTGTEASYREALDLRRQLAKANPEAYLPDVAMTAANMSLFFLHSQPDKEKSLAYAREAVQAAQPLMEIIPAAKGYVDAALGVAEAWGLSRTALWEEEATQKPHR